ncbi:neprosin family prolyl endopeptidase [Actinoplanes xinjiangensis]|uniref:neprosin family prolyl endopeptidase n=1 Tax=Actinoplanes xinjiangensis TaxID=512350 RepID=UPI0034286C3E
MSNSRRGAFAAALVAVVVGSIGLTSTLNAGAEEVPEPAPAVVSPAPEEESELAPPPRLPWGAAPTSLDTGTDGASSEMLQSSGLDAAAPDDEAATDEYAPKGRSTRTGVLRSEPTEIVPPRPPTMNQASQTVYFHYNVGSQAAVTDGAYANFSINKPTLASADYHTLAELAVQSSSGNQIVEVGWNVDQVVNGDDDPHLFVFHWVNGQPTCYNGCGFVQYSANISPGDTLPQDVTKRLGIQYYNGAWWIAYDTEWVGYYPAALWSGGFTQTGLVQVFGEVAAAAAAPCTDMGNGLHGASDTSSARIGSVSYINGPAVDMYVRSTSNHYDVTKLSGRTFRYGGPGAC